MVRIQLKLKAKTRASLLVFAGVALLSAGAALVYFPAGLLVAGTASILAGLFLVDVEGAREPRTARTLRPPR